MPVGDLAPCPIDAGRRSALDLARTGEGFDTFLRRRDELIQDGKRAWLTWYIGDYTSLEQMRWSWDHVLPFDPRPALSRIECPALSVFGHFDLSTDATTVPFTMRDGILAGSQQDVTVRVFPNASHSLMEKLSFEQPSGDRMAPGVFDTLREWVATRVS
jgi:pimeloyl-ACP methyl ester carboxylesterase